MGMTENQRQRAQLVGQLTDNEEFQIAVANKLDAKHRWRWIVIGIWIVLFSGTAIALYYANRHRINDVQKSRVESCQRTYSSFLTVFRPFFPPRRQDWSIKQNEDWAKLVE